MPNQLVPVYWYMLHVTLKPVSKTGELMFALWSYSAFYIMLSCEELLQNQINGSFCSGGAAAGGSPLCVMIKIVQ